MKRIRRAIIILTVLMTAATAGTEAEHMAINKTNIRRVELTGGIVRDTAPAVIGERDISADRFGIDVFPARPLASAMVEVPLFADPGTQYTVFQFCENFAAACQDITG